jgi:hypothetical protein
MAKYFQLKMKGARRAEEVESEVGAAGATILRIHTEGGETHVYYTMPEGGGNAPRAKKLEGAKEVSIDDVTKIH